MMPYLDFGFVAVLILPARGNRAAWDIVQRFSAPFRLSYLHSRQIEVLLARARAEGNPRQRVHAEAGVRFWKHYLQEGVFALQTVSWEGAFQVAHNCVRSASAPVPQPTHYLHAALAESIGASHFLSFQPRSRSPATAAGIKVLPERL
jgi:hypothetical protein